MEIFNNLCRACNTTQNNLVNIFTDQQNESTTIKNMLEYCLLMPIHNEEMYPELICYFCIKELEISYRFLHRFKLAQKEFEKTYEHIKNIEKNTEDNSSNCGLEETSQVFEEKYNEYDELPQQLQIIDEIKLTNSSVEQLESVGNTYTEINLPKSENLPAASCSICKKLFFTTKALDLHLKISHKNKIEKSTNNFIVDKCEILENCHEKSENTLNTDCNTPTKHPRTEVEIKMEYTQSIASVTSIEMPPQFIPALVVEQKTDTAKNCAVCNKSFLTVKALSLHLKLAHKQKSQ